MAPPKVEAAMPSRKRALEAPEIPLNKRTRRAASNSEKTFNDSGNESDADLQPTNSQDDVPITHLLSPDDHRFILRPSIHACTFTSCNRTFDRASRLLEHERMHTGDRPFLCDHPGCGKTFPRDYHLSRHKQDVHEGLRRHPCTYEGCDKKYATKQKLKAHLDSHVKKAMFMCTGYEGCSQSFRKKNTLQAHINAVHLKKKSYPCTYADSFTGEPCSNGYDTEGKLKSHISKVHEGGDRFVCTICSGGAATDSGISIPGDDMSVASTTLSMPSYAFPTRNSLQSHMAKAHPPTCPHCLAPCPKRNLANHIEVMHPDVATMLPPRPPSQMFPCTSEDCGRVFTKVGNLTVHVQTVHKNVRAYICGKVDLAGSRKLQHENGEDIPFDNAEGCGMGFGTKAQLQNHVRTHHLGLENWGTTLQRRRGELPEVSTKPRKKAGGNQKAKLFSATSLLTGHGYEQSGRDIPCLDLVCANLFFREVDLRRHCSAVHGMADVEIGERLRERAALDGGVFWYGGIHPAEERGFAEYEEDDEDFDAQLLRRRGPAGEAPVDPALDNMDRVAEYVKGVEGGADAGC